MQGLTADPPRTPARLSHLAGTRDPNKSTPLAKGSSDNSEYAISSGQDDYAPFLAHDVANEFIMPVKDFLTWILRVEPPKPGDYSHITTQPDFCTHMDQYTTTKYTHEIQLYRPFVNLANWCLSKLGVVLVCFCRNDPQYILDSDALRKPDVVNVKPADVNQELRDGVDNLSKAGPKSSPFYWRELLAFWEFKLQALLGLKEPKAKASLSKSKPAVASEPQKRTMPTTATQSAQEPQSTPPRTTLKPASDALEGKQPKKMPAKLQCASYALELMSNGGLRSHIISVLISRNHIELLYYDRSMVIKSTPVDFAVAKNHPTFLSILSGFGKLDRQQWGYPNLLMPPVAPNTPQKLPVTGPLDKDFWRGMYKGYIFKLNDGWVLALEDIIFRAHGIIGRGTVVIRATVTKCPPSREDLMGKIVVVKWGWIPTTRANEAEIVKSARDRAQQGNEHILRHLPEILHEQSFEELTPACQRDLLRHLPSGMYEERVFRLIVLAELRPITELNDPNKLAKVFKQIFVCYRWLIEEAKIIHRDVSITNLMYHEIAGEVYGVLNDFDLALRLGDATVSTSKQRTGTKPYMAIDLLVDSPPSHLYRHDLESFLYVLVFLTCKIEGSDLAKWKDLGIDQLKKAKTSAIADEGFAPNKNHFQDFRLWILDLTDLFGTGINNRRLHNNAVEQAKRRGGEEPEFDEKTLGGAVDFEKFAAILEQPITS